ncbi:MAG: DUF4157 domain-containing protein [Salinibacter sp.]|uniref:eCIS core domain-containing protein n=1 Tax=Salinibacter sp. TaxID=2065818 RepID=UPI002FC2FCCA
MNEPGDQYEREADRVADAVMRMPDSEAAVNTLEDVPSERLQRMCPRCRRRHRQGKPLNCEECEQELQRKPVADGLPATEDVEQATAVASEPGKPLSGRTRSFFEDRMGGDFGDVRIHTGRKAGRAARSIDARAFTLGNDVVFRSDMYRPGTRVGKQLLAHELTHVAQQSGAAAMVQRQSTGSKEETENPDQEESGVELETWADLWQRGGGMRTFDGGIQVGAVYFSTDEATLDSIDRVALGQLRQQLSSELAQRDRRYTLQFVGWADKRGSEQYNLDLSLDRAINVSSFFESLSDFPNYQVETKPMGEFTGEQRGETAQELAVYRRVDIVLKPSITNPIRKPESEEEGGNTEKERKCDSAKEGFPPSRDNCAAYEKNSWWLPSEYVHNATCACMELPDSPTANCVRDHLQDRMEAVPTSTKEYWQRIVAITEAGEWIGRGVPWGEIPQEEAEMLIQLELARLIYKHHKEAYEKCCCKGGPAPFPSWVGVVNVPLPCEGVEASIRAFGSCGRGGW